MHFIKEGDYIPPLNISSGEWIYPIFIPLRFLNLLHEVLPYTPKGQGRTHIIAIFSLEQYLNRCFILFLKVLVINPRLSAISNPFLILVCANALFIIFSKSFIISYPCCDILVNIYSLVEGNNESINRNATKGEK